MFLQKRFAENLSCRIFWFLMYPAPDRLYVGRVEETAYEVDMF